MPRDPDRPPAEGDPGGLPNRDRAAVARRCAILAGGAGSRLGGGKALVALGGRPLIEHVRDAAARAGLEPTVVAKPDSDLGALGDTALREPAAPRHPLLGIAYALERFAEPLVVCPCDLPLIPPDLLRSLAAHPDPLVVVSAPAGVEPLLGRYPPAAAEALRVAAERDLPATGAVLALGPSLLSDLEAFGNPERFLLNVNTPVAVEAAAAQISSPDS